MNEARKLISKKVDILCNDLITAYGDLSRQVETVRSTEGFRKSLDTAADLEQLLCHAMDWLLRQVGYSNVAVWLTGEDGEYQLGAYMKYTVPGDPALTAALKREVLPLAARDATDAVVRAKSADLRDRLKARGVQPVQGPRRAGHELHVPGRVPGRADLLPRRAHAVPPGGRVAAQVDRPGLRLALANIVRDSAEPDGDDDDADDANPANDTIILDDADDRGTPGGSGGGNGRHDNNPRRGGGDGPGRRKKPQQPDAADWWKRGEPPPF